MAYRKKQCYVVYAYYKDDEELPAGYEEELYSSYSAALEAKEEWELNPDIDHVNLEDEEREVWVDDNEALAIDLKTKSNGWLMETLDDEVQKLVGVSNEKWITSIPKSYYLALIKEISRRLNNPLNDPLIDMMN